MIRKQHLKKERWLSWFFFSVGEGQINNSVKLEGKVRLNSIVLFFFFTTILIILHEILLFLMWYH